MKNADKILDQLFAQARRVRSLSQAPAELSKGLENRILADWRRVPADDSFSLVVPIFRWGFGAAITASLLIIATTSMLDRSNEFFTPPVQISTYAGPMVP